MVKNNTVDWNTQKNDFLIFGFSRVQKMALDKMRKEGLIKLPLFIFLFFSYLVLLLFLLVL
jgi:hypothetical protein